MVAPRDLYLINYFPSALAGYNMWTNYNGSTISSDFQKIVSLGFNTVRIFIPADNMAFNYPSPTAQQISRLTDIYNRARALGLKLRICLFDSFGVYGNISAANTFINFIRNAFPDTDFIHSVELQNETPFSSTANYTSTYQSYPGGTPTTQQQIGTVSTVFAQQIVPALKTLFNKPTTISCCSGTKGLSDLQVAFNNLNGIVDWFEWHCYTANNLCGLIYSTISMACNIVPAENLFIGEGGCSSQISSPLSETQGEVLQYDWLENFRWVCYQLGLGEPGIWMLNDLSTNSSWTSQQFLGLYDQNGQIKLSGQLYQQKPPGTCPNVPNRLGNINSLVFDSYGNSMPAGWYLYRGSNGTQVINSTVDNCGINLFGSGNSNTIPGNPPGIYTINPGMPIITPNNTYVWSCSLRGVGTYGNPRMWISWYDSAGGFITTTQGSTLNLTDTPQLFTLSSVAPANAVYCRCSLITDRNSGHIYIVNSLVL